MRHRRKTKKLTLFDQIILRFKLDALIIWCKIIIIYFTGITCNNSNNNNNNNNNNNSNNNDNDNNHLSESISQ